MNGFKSVGRNADDLESAILLEMVANTALPIDKIIYYKNADERWIADSLLLKGVQDEIGGLREWTHWRKKRITFGEECVVARKQVGECAGAIREEEENWAARNNGFFVLVALEWRGFLRG